MARLALYIYLALGILSGSLSKEIDKEMTVKVKPSSVDCFYQNLEVNDIIDIEYQVILS